MNVVKKELTDRKESIEALKEQLLNRKAELEQELIALRQEKFSDDQVQDAADQALSATMDTLKSSFQDTKIDEFKRIVRALAMIEEGTYGICVDCERMISPKRLQSFPNAMRCIACQEALEESGGE